MPSASIRTLALEPGRAKRDTNYEQQCGHEVLREANNELHNSDERNFMKCLVLKVVMFEFRVPYSLLLGLRLPLLLQLGLEGFALWVVSEIALNEYRSKYG